MTVAAIFCGISALTGLLILTHTSSHTPTVHEVPIYLGQRVLRSESKEWYLLSPELLLMFFFFWTAYYALTWKRFVLKLNKNRDAFVRQFPRMDRLNLPTLLIVVSCLICGFSAFHLWDLVSRSRDVWGLV
jgi:hypothetical protein